MIESKRTTALWIAYLLSRIGVGDRQLWLIKYLIWCIINYCSLIFNLNNLYAMLHHGGDAELTQLGEEERQQFLHHKHTHEDLLFFVLFCDRVFTIAQAIPSF